MPESQSYPAWVKPTLEFGPVLGFFAAFMLLRGQSYEVFGESYDALVLVTAGFVPILLICTGLMWKITGELQPMQAITAALVLVFGGLTVWLNDPQFIKMKPTLLYVLFGGALLVGLLRGQSWLQHVLGQALPLDDLGWKKLTQRACGLFFGLALANEIAWRFFSEETWISFKTFGLPVLLIAFFALQSGLIARHSTEVSDPNSN